ncbi:MAG TPA: hypothetical protein PLF79_14750, partial [Thauera sp.]|nr:hypothetical protein [Thauera sp.]
MNARLHSLPALEPIGTAGVESPPDRWPVEATQAEAAAASVAPAPSLSVTPVAPVAPDDAALAARFRPIFARIAERAAEREHARELASDAVGWRREVRFGALRVPVEQGGFGASVEQFFALLIELA